MTKNKDKLLGSVFGNAVGDALGAPAEFKSREMCLTRWPEGVREMEPAGQTRAHVGGCYTDDTEMGVAMALGILRAGRVYGPALAEEFAYWYGGYPPDVGCQTSGVLSRIGTNFSHAVDMAMTYCGESQQGNGSVMRHGLLLPYNSKASLLEALQDAEMQSSVTHPAQACVDSCKYMTLIQLRILDGATPTEALKFATVYARFHNWHPAVAAYAETISKISSSKKLPTSGWVVDTMIRALWYLDKDMGFEDGIADCVVHGGDADSAGAVCGALLGTLYGYEAIPKRWIDAVEKAEIAAKREITLRELTNQLIACGDKQYGVPWQPTRVFGKRLTGGRILMSTSTR